MILDLGCGAAKVEGAVGIDNVALPGVDVVHDLLDFPYPFDANSVDEVYLNHVIEHFSLSDAQQILRQVYRILQPDGILHVHVPHAFSVAAWIDPTHKSVFTFLSALFWTRQADKSYYKETDNLWDLTATTTRVTWFNWKRYRLRQFDAWISGYLASLLNRLLRMQTWPGAADLLIKAIPTFLVEIRWEFRKPQAE